MNDLADPGDGDGVFDAPEWLDAVDVKLKGLGVKRRQRTWVREVLGMAEVDVLPEPSLLTFVVARRGKRRRLVIAAWSAGGRDCGFKFLGSGRATVVCGAVGSSPVLPADMTDDPVASVRRGLSWVYPGLYGEMIEP